jgi:squalene synthase HpnC
MAVDHYENFPVASLLLPRALRAAVRDIYRYARCADDIADEGNASPSERLAELAEFRHGLDCVERDLIEHPVISALHPARLPRPDIFLPLRHTIVRHSLPISLFRDLLSAFEQDVTKHRYENDAELLDYCQRSANPVGRLLLHLYDRVEAENLQRSDAICSGLQLVNFWQDVAVDWRKNRVYLPRDKRECHGVTEDWIARCSEAGKLLAGGSDAVIAEGWRCMMQAQVGQAREFLRFGEPLCAELPWRAGLELRLVVQGGLRILERLDQLNYDVFARRPVLRPSDWCRMALRALFT